MTRRFPNRLQRKRFFARHSRCHPEARAQPDTPQVVTLRPRTERSKTTARPTGPKDLYANGLPIAKALCTT